MNIGTDIRMKYLCADCASASGWSLVTSTTHRMACEKCYQVATVKLYMAPDYDKAVVK